MVQWARCHLPTRSRDDRLRTFSVGRRTVLMASAVSGLDSFGRGTCALTNRPRHMLEAQEKIGPEHFYVPAHRAIWEVLVSMFEKNKPLHIIALTQELRDRNLLDSVGGAAYVTAWALLWRRRRTLVITWT